MKRCPRLDKKQLNELQSVVFAKDSSAKEIRRAQAVLMLDCRTAVGIIKQITGHGKENIFRLRRSYLRCGLKTIQCDKKKIPPELLTKKQRQEIIEIITTKKPSDCDDYFANYSYWTTNVLADLIKRKYKTQYKSKTSLYLIFRASKFTYHKPGRVYQKRDEGEVKKWRKTAKPIVEKAIAEPNTVVLCEDEMVLSTQTTFQKIWLPKGEYPKIEASNKKENRSIYGFLNVKTGVEYAFKTEWQNMFITAKILKNIRKIYPIQKLLLLWDGPGWHKGKEVIKFIEEDKNITILHFPKYSPEENPQEHVWKKGRSVVTHNFTINDINKTADDFVKYLNRTKFTYSLLGFSAVL